MIPKCVAWANPGTGPGSDNGRRQHWRLMSLEAKPSVWHKPRQHSVKPVYPRAVYTRLYNIVWVRATGRRSRARPCSTPSSSRPRRQSEATCRKSSCRRTIEEMSEETVALSSYTDKLTTQMRGQSSSRTSHVQTILISAQARPGTHTITPGSVSARTIPASKSSIGGREAGALGDIAHGPANISAAREAAAQ